MTKRYKLLSFVSMPQETSWKNIRVGPFLVEYLFVTGLYEQLHNINVRGVTIM